MSTSRRSFLAGLLATAASFVLGRCSSQPPAYACDHAKDPDLAKEFRSDDGCLTRDDLDRVYETAMERACPINQPAGFWGLPPDAQNLHPNEPVQAVWYHTDPTNLGPMPPGSVVAVPADTVWRVLPDGRMVAFSQSADRNRELSRILATLNTR